MTRVAIRDAQPGKRPAQADPTSAIVAVSREIDNRMAIIRTSAAAGIDPERLKLVALTVFTRTPALLACEPVSVARAIVEAGQLGLEPTGLLGGAYLVPRGGKATLLVGYRGLVMLAKRSGEVQRVEARVVRAKDPVFEYGYGLEPYLRHVPSQDLDPGNLVAAYAVIVYRDGERQFDVMSHAEVEAIRKRSSSPNDGPWVTDYFEMAKKTVLRRLLKMAPLTIEVARKLDELDPEVAEAPRSDPGRQAELRHQLQAALAEEYGTPEPATINAPALTAGEGQADTDTSAGSSAVVVEVEAVAAPQVASDRQRGPASRGTPTEAEVQDTPGPAPATCGVSHEGLGVGPCILAPDHQPPQEHEQAGGVRWSQPR